MTKNSDVHPPQISSKRPPPMHSTQPKKWPIDEGPGSCVGAGGGGPGGAGGDVIGLCDC